MDVCFLVASSAKKSYQKLSETYSAIEPPTWALLLAQSCRSINFKVSIIDANAENLSNEQKDNFLKDHIDMCHAVVNADNEGKLGKINFLFKTQVEGEVGNFIDDIEE